MLELLSPAVSDNRAAAAVRFAAAVPFRHVVVDDFFLPAVLEALREQFPPFASGCAVNEHGDLGGKATREDLTRLGEPYRSVDRMLQSAEFRRLISDITEVPDLLYDPFYFGGGTHENRAGQELDPHVDFNFHPEFGWHRRLNLIVFLHEVWESSWGGELELHSDPWDPAGNRVQSILPRANRCVLFETTEASWHGFRAVSPPAEHGEVTRKSLAVYYYTRSRPQDQTAPRHSTVYVPRPLPDHLKAGCVLSEDDAMQIRAAVARRDGQLRYLYDREKQFEDTIARLQRSYYSDRPLTGLPRRLVKQLKRWWRARRAVADLRR